jgi:hypothetical protein
VSGSVAVTPKVESQLNKSTPNTIRLNLVTLKSLKVNLSRPESMKSGFFGQFSDANGNGRRGCFVWVQVAYERV